jgi:hypothetical protein
VDGQVRGQVHRHRQQPVAVFVDERPVLALEHVHLLRPGYVRQADAVALALHGVSDADAAPGDADGLLPLGVALLVQGLVAGQHQVGPVGDEHPAGAVDAAVLEHLELLEQGLGVDDHARARMTVLSGTGCPTDEVQGVLLSVDDQRVARVGAAGEADDYLRLIRQIIDDLSLSLIAPLGTYDDYVHARSYDRE